jgi:hypothetical protein
MGLPFLLTMVSGGRFDIEIRPANGVLEDKLTKDGRTITSLYTRVSQCDVYE